MVNKSEQKFDEIKRKTRQHALIFPPAQ